MGDQWNLDLKPDLFTCPEDEPCLSSDTPRQGCMPAEKSWLMSASATTLLKSPAYPLLESVQLHSPSKMASHAPMKAANTSVASSSSVSKPEFETPCIGSCKSSDVVKSNYCRGFSHKFCHPTPKFVSEVCAPNADQKRKFQDRSIKLFHCEKGQYKRFKISQTSCPLIWANKIKPLRLNNPPCSMNYSRNKYLKIHNQNISKKSAVNYLKSKINYEDSRLNLSCTFCFSDGKGFLLPRILEADLAIPKVEHYEDHPIISPFKSKKYYNSVITCKAKMYNVRINIQGGGSVYPRTCNTCQGIYLSKSSFSNHIRNKRCEQRCMVMETLEKNSSSFFANGTGVCRYIQGGSAKYPRTCPKCQSTYSHTTSYFRHLKNKTCEQNMHKRRLEENPNYSRDDPNADLDRPDLHVCPGCNTAYNSERSLKRHQKTTCQKHKVSFIPCVHPGCAIKFHLQLTMIRHLADAHNVDLGIQKKNFLTIEDFNEWKKFEERRTFTMLTKRRGDYFQAGKKSQYYSCMFNVQERKSLPVRKYRHAHSKNNLVNTYCPARVDTLEGPNGVEVTYYSYHNHELNPENLKYCKWNLETKDFINKMIENKVPVNKIKEELTSNSLDMESPVPLKEHFITTRQISRMKYDLSAKMKINKKDTVSIQLLVNDIVSEKPDSILVYKPQGKPVELGEVPSEQLSNSYLFVLGIQQERQRVELINSCRKVLCINVENFSKMYNFSLVSFFIQDEFSEGYPIAHFISNRLDSSTLTSLFSIFKAKNPHFNLNAFMTEDNHVLYDAFFQVFNRKPIHLLCKIDVKASLLRQLNEKVENSSLVAEMYSSLMAMLEENDIETFKTMLSNFLSKYEDSSPNFCKHFSQRYAKKAESWAMCFRNLPYAAADSSEFCQVFLRKIKFAYRLQKANRRIDDFINVLLKTDRFFHLALSYKRFTNEIPHIEGTELYSRHSEGLLIPDENVTAMNVSKSKFKVKSDTNDDIHYTVSVLVEKCSVPTVCYIQCHKISCYPLCCHMYSCTCPDQNSLCKHIHKVHSLNKLNVTLPKSDKRNESDESDCELSFSKVLKKVIPPPELSEEEKLTALSKKTVKDLETRLSNPRTLPLSHHINLTVNSLISECDMLISRPEPPKIVKESTPNNTCPPPIVPNTHQIDHAYTDLSQKTKIANSNPLPPSLAPNKTIVVGNGAKPQTPKIRHAVRIPLTNLNRVDRSKNFSGLLKLSDSLFTTLYKLGPYEVKLYHLKSLDPDIPDEDLERIQIEVPDFKRGWLYDCVIYSFFMKISQPYIYVKVIDPCISQLVSRSNGDPVPMESLSHYEKILIPCNPDESHWLLIIAYPALKLIHFFDPQSNVVEPEYHRFIGIWAKTLSKASGTSLKEWQMKSPKHTKQSDNLNCGVFIAWYADQVLKSKPTSALFNIGKYREYMYDTLKGGLDSSKMNQ